MESITEDGDKDRMPRKKGSKWAAKMPRKSSKAIQYATAQELKRMVKKEIAKQAEDKVHTYELGPYTIFQSIDSATTYPLLPTIKQGVEQGQRIGNKIKLKRFNVKLAVNVFNQATNVSPVYVDLYIFKIKSVSMISTSQIGFLPAPIMENFLQAGSGTTQYTGTTLDGLRDVNKDLFYCLFRKRMLLYNPLNSTSVQGSTSTFPPAETHNIDITKYVKRGLEFNDDSNSCTNESVWIAVGSTQTDGALVVANIGRYSLIVNFDYEDM